MRTTRTRRALLAATAALALTLTACSSAEDTSAPAETTAATDACAKENLALRTAGTLTIGTDNPAYEPWFKDNDPTNGEGFESAVAYAVAEQLGFSAAEVEWVVAPFNNIIAPGEKNFDFAINQVSIRDERKEAVDFTSGYYNVKQALITVAGSPIEGATTIAELKDAKIGAQIGTTSYAVITDLIQPNVEPGSFDTNDIAKQALANGQIDGLIVDLPTAFYITAVELENGVIVGQFETVDENEQFGLVLDKGSALTSCVSQAVDALIADGTIAGIEEEWLARVTNAPVIKP